MYLSRINPMNSGLQVKHLKLNHSSTPSHILLLSHKIILMYPVSSDLVTLEMSGEHDVAVDRTLKTASRIDYY